MSGMILFKMGNKDYTQFITMPSYKVVSKPITKEYEDVNKISHKQYIRDQISGSFTLKFFDTTKEIDIAPENINGSFGNVEKNNLFRIEKPNTHILDDSDRLHIKELTKARAKFYYLDSKYPIDGSAYLADCEAINKVKLANVIYTEYKLEILDKKAADEFQEFFNNYQELRLKSGLIQITVYVNNLNTIKTISADIEMDPANTIPYMNGGKEYDGFDVTIKER